jgi:hypothetical protein
MDGVASEKGFVLGAAYAMAAGQVMRIREYSIE